MRTASSASSNSIGTGVRLTSCENNLTTRLLKHSNRKGGKTSAAIIIPDNHAGQAYTWPSLRTLPSSISAQPRNRLVLGTWSCDRPRSHSGHAVRSRRASDLFRSRPYPDRRKRHPRNPQQRSSLQEGRVSVWRSSCNRLVRKMGLEWAHHNGTAPHSLLLEQSVSTAVVTATSLGLHEWRPFYLSWSCLWSGAASHTPRANVIARAFRVATSRHRDCVGRGCPASRPVNNRLQMIAAGWCGRHHHTRGSFTADPVGRWRVGGVQECRLLNDQSGTRRTILSNFAMERRRPWRGGRTWRRRAPRCAWTGCCQRRSAPSAKRRRSPAQIFWRARSSLAIETGPLARLGARPDWRPLRCDPHARRRDARTAKALGLTVPPSLLVRANEVIEWASAACAPRSLVSSLQLSSSSLKKHSWIER